MARQLQHYNAPTDFIWHGLSLGCTAGSLDSETIERARLFIHEITANRV